MRRFLLKLLPGLCLLLLAGTALAGGVVVSLVGDVPNPEAGQPFDVRFDIFSAHDGSVQPGFHPIVTAINAETGETITAQAAAADVAGQYQATLTLPSAGTWQWTVTPDSYYPAELVAEMTPLTVVAPGPAAAPAAPTFAGVAPMQWLLLAALAVVAVIAVLTGRRLPAVRA
jgi:hypothetical protein